MILEASCDRCGEIIEAKNEPYKIIVDYNGEILCNSCKINGKNREIIFEIEKIKLSINNQYKDILKLQSELIKK